MPSSHSIQCRCGQLRGLLTATRPSNHCICYCTDCQAFARHLGAHDALDKQGGTEIIQAPAANLTFSQGVDTLACLRLTDTGMLRWYTTCCQTPIGNTLANWRVSFVGLIHTCLRAEGQSLDTSFGPVTMRVSVKSAIGQEKPVSSGLLDGIAKTIAMIVRARISGAYRRSPFFDPRNGTPVAHPKVLTSDELQAAKRMA